VIGKHTISARCTTFDLPVTNNQLLVVHFPFAIVCAVRVFYLGVPLALFENRYSFIDVFRAQVALFAPSPSAR
jgi:hypothetical protein